MAEITTYELLMAEKRHDPARVNAKHLNRHSLHISNLRLLKGVPQKVSEWWFSKNRALVDELVRNGQLIVRMPDGNTLGAPEAVPAQVSMPEVPAPAAPPAPEVPAPQPVVPEVTAPQAPEPPPVADDLSVLPVRGRAMKNLLAQATTFAEVEAMGVPGLVERAGLTPAQAEKVLEAVRGRR